MSPRIKRIRKVVNPPTIKGFKPYGLQRRDENAESVNLLIEEYEALRLCDYESYNQFDASIMMGVSRPTFTRIYASALQKIATAFVKAGKWRLKEAKCISTAIGINAMIVYVSLIIQKKHSYYSLSFMRK